VSANPQQTAVPLLSLPHTSPTCSQGCQGRTQSPDGTCTSRPLQFMPGLTQLNPENQRVVTASMISSFHPPHQEQYFSW